MIDALTSANMVGDWSAQLGIALPKSLTKVLETYEEARYIQAYPPVVDASKLTGDLDAEVAKLAEELARAEHHADAKRRVQVALAGSVLSEAAKAVPGLVEAIKPKFDAEVARLTEALELLPDDLTPDAIVQANDPAILAALADAREAAADLRSIDQWVVSLVQLPAYQGDIPEPGVRIVAPETPGQLRQIQTTGNHTPIEQELGPILVNATRAGVQFRINTPDQSRILADDLAEADAARRAANPMGAMKIPGMMRL